MEESLRMPSPPSEARPPETPQPNPIFEMTDTQRQAFARWSRAQGYDTRPEFEPITAQVQPPIDYSQIQSEVSPTYTLHRVPSTPHSDEDWAFTTSDKHSLTFKIEKPKLALSKLITDMREHALEEL
jgi:hypothetical protein